MIRLIIAIALGLACLANAQNQATNPLGMGWFTFYWSADSCVCLPEEGDIPLVPIGGKSLELQFTDLEQGGEQYECYLGNNYAETFVSNGGNCCAPPCSNYTLDPDQAFGSGFFFANGSVQGASGFARFRWITRVNCQSVYAAAYRVVFVDCDSDGINDTEAIQQQIVTDCNENGVPDQCDINLGLRTDCDSNGVPDDCETLDDCNQNSIPDLCENLSDCDNDGIADTCQKSFDCNNNGINDKCDTSIGTSEDLNKNFVPDECECIADIVENGTIGFDDLVAVTSTWGPCGAACPGDFISDGTVGLQELLYILSSWGPCSG